MVSTKIPSFLEVTVVFLSSYLKEGMYINMYVCVCMLYFH